MNIHKIALEAGALDACCLSTKNPNLLKAIAQNSSRYKRWLDAEQNGDMHYLKKGFEIKKNFSLTWKDYQSVIVITFNNDWGKKDAWHNFPKSNPKTNLVGYISAYAKQNDYHYVGKKILQKIADKFRIEDKQTNYKICVDTTPLFERTLATFGGLGELAINDLLRTPNHGVRVFIGSLFIDQKLEELIHQPKMPFPCKYCNNCLQQCPTGAIQDDGSFIVKKCSSYLSIETKGVLSKQQRQDMNGWLFGCDDCTIVCPPKDKLPTRIKVDLHWLLKTPTNQLKKIIKNTAIEYAGVTKLRRNAVALLQENNSQEAKKLLNWVRKNNKSPLVAKQLDTY